MPRNQNSYYRVRWVSLDPAWRGAEVWRSFSTKRVALRFARSLAVPYAVEYGCNSDGFARVEGGHV